MKRVIKTQEEINMIQPSVEAETELFRNRTTERAVLIITEIVCAWMTKHLLIY